MYKSIIIDTETTRLPIKKEPKNNKIDEKIKTYLVLFSFQLKLENFKEKKIWSKNKYYQKSFT